MRLSIRPLGLAVALPVALLAAMVSSGCKKRPIGGNREGYILGPVSQIVSASKATVPAGNQDVLAASALIVTKISPTEVKFCSGTLIPSEQPGEFGRILTNHHCFAQEDAQGLATAVLLPQACVATKVYFGFIAGSTDSASISNCQVGTLRTSFDGDLAVFKLGMAIPSAFKPLQVAPADFKPDGRDAVVVHYPAIDEHMVVPPGGGPKVPTAALTLGNCRVVSGFPIGQWELDRSLPFGLKHTCDIIHGSSGSGLVDRQTNQLLGVDWGGLKIDGGGGQETINVATRASFVQAFLTYKTEQAEASAASTLAQQEQDKSTSVSLGDRTQQVLSSASKSCGVVAAPGSGHGASLPVVLLLALPLLVLGGPKRLGALGFGLLLLGATPSPQALTQLPTPLTNAGVDRPGIMPSPLSPTAGWAASYLLSTAFIVEYLSVDALQPQARGTTGPWSAPWLRAYFAASSLRAKGQSGPSSPELAARLQAHSDVAAASKLDKAAESDLVAQSEGEARAGMELIAASFNPAAAKRWQHLAAAYALPAPTCPLDYAEVKAFAAHQHQLQLAGSGQSINQMSLLKPLRGWSEAKIQCLAFALMQGVADRLDQGFDPLPLITALTVSGAPMAKDISMRALAATRLLQLGEYPETLRTLLELVDLDDDYRLPYELVQRAYSLRQKGGGSVALQGI